MTAGIRHDEMRKRNRTMVISAVRQAGRASRTEITRSTGLSHSTISAIAADLIDEGIMRELRDEETAPARRGRPQVALSLSPDAGCIVVLVLIFNRLTASLVDYCGNKKREKTIRLQTLEMSRQELCEAAISAVREIAGGEGPILHISFGVQGLTDSAGREMLWSPITVHRNVAFAEALESAFGVPVSINNDCNLIALALRWRKPDRYRDNFVAILLSHGIGMGLMVDGRMFTGKDSSGGELGHMTYMPGGALCRCGRLGCVEAYAGNYAIWRKATGQSPMAKPVTDMRAAEMERLTAEAREEDGPARQAFREAGEAIGYAIGNLFALIDPAPIAMIGQGTAAFDILEPSIRHALAQTLGGQNAQVISFETEPEETPLIAEGSAMLALAELDRKHFGAGAALPA
ncbi:ROK family transcriptional regulator [Nitratireductor sp. CH_MIT9313-5]|jgi:predicted NBD/HSP70 family sugar kinase|uniref:ROK family transcriptional regulator n=1 Tax=Nitratireductor sp. CH_MIT9313-5 TaxID=3107764 RepID=UPI003009879B